VKRLLQKRTGTAGRNERRGKSTAHRRKKYFALDKAFFWQESVAFRMGKTCSPIRCRRALTVSAEQFPSITLRHFLEVFPNTRL
jgi:hypothetical protein